MKKRSHISDLNLIKTLDYKSLDESTKNQFLVILPDFKKLHNLEKNLKKLQVRPRNIEESRNVRRRV